ncbi:hypothetical protein D3C86_1723260 [compost metagenome]
MSVNCGLSLTIILKRPTFMACALTLSETGYDSPEISLIKVFDIGVLFYVYKYKGYYTLP